MNVYQWLFSSKEDVVNAVNAVTALRDLFYEGRSEMEWVEISKNYETTLLELIDTIPSDLYANGSIEMAFEQFDDVSYVEMYGMENKERFALDFIPWKDVLSLKAESLMLSPLPKSELIAHLLVELTFDGFTEGERERRKDELYRRLSESENE